MSQPPQLPQNQCFSANQQQQQQQVIQQQLMMQQQLTQQQQMLPYPQAPLQSQVKAQQLTMPQQVAQQPQLYQYQQTNRSIPPQQSPNEQPSPITSQRTNQQGNNNLNKHNLSTSDPVDDPPTITKHTWQTIKRKRLRSTPEEATEDQFKLNTQNKFAELSDLEDEDMQTNDVNKFTTKSNQPREKKPPPIYIYGVTNYREMIKYISEVVEEEQYYCKALPKETIKINASTADTYRKLIRKIQEDKIMHHTYQIRDERAYRIVLRNLHHSIPTEQIKEELQNHGHTVRNILNIQHRQTKEPLPLFFVDIEPKVNNKNIYDIEFLCNSRIRVEAPRKKNTIVQCTRCQCYGHTKSYCMKPYACVKCGEGHNSTSCKKSPNTPPKCALCGGTHPANYKGCNIYKNLQNARRGAHSSKLTATHNPNPIISTTDLNQFPHLPTTQQQEFNYSNNNNISDSTNFAPIPLHQPTLYSQIVTQNQQSSSVTEQLSALLNEFKTMFSQLISQNSMIINMLSTVINKIAN